ncbi:cysteine--tRNA ligase [Candidatus Marsarchaeota archaeon]|nr:cysteine--tRNA ligase [Candidatus Marsarchaeota archaeon]
MGGGLRLYNTLTRRLEEFQPLEDGKIRFFVCGQTVYDDAHLGHAKAYINFDIVARWLRHLGYTLHYIQNITDIDDKIITRAKESHKDPTALAREFESRFMEDMEKIGVKKNVDQYPRSHDYIDEIGLQIGLLLKKGYAYLLDGDVYYDVSKFEDYTKLSGMKLEELEKHRIEPKVGKRNPYDFALWKASKEGEPSWKISLDLNGKEITLDGRPGWHIEDTAITHAIFGPQYDLHGGAIELIFPHHSNEIAQAEAAFGKKPFVKYWLHAGVLNIKGVKMSKSLRNFIKIRDVFPLYSAETLRLLICSTHYRKEMDYDENLIKNAGRKLSYLYAALGIFYNMREGASNKEGSEQIKKETTLFVDAFTKAMNDDFNTPQALTELTLIINKLREFAETNNEIDAEAKIHALSSILKMANTLGILTNEGYKTEISTTAMHLISYRERLRQDKNFGEADTIRERLKNEFKILLEDTEYGTIWYKEQ